MNPIRRARLENSLTQSELAYQCDMSRLAVIRYEQGLYQNISEKITEVLGVTQDSYSTWRIMQQESARPYMKPIPFVRTNPDGEHPIVQFRKIITQRAVGKSSQMSFCILLALHPGTVAQYEKCRLRKLPNAIRVALHNAGVSEAQIDELDTFGQFYYDHQ